MQGTQSYYEEFLVSFCRLIAHYIPVATRLAELDNLGSSPADEVTSTRVSNVKHRLLQVENAFCSIKVVKIQESIGLAAKRLSSDVVRFSGFDSMGFL